MVTLLELSDKDEDLKRVDSCWIAPCSSWSKPLKIDQMLDSTSFHPAAAATADRKWGGSTGEHETTKVEDERGWKGFPSFSNQKTVTASNKDVTGTISLIARIPVIDSIAPQCPTTCVNSVLPVCVSQSCNHSEPFVTVTTPLWWPPHPLCRLL